ncbi:MAG TPA: FtsX-like permease family protein [Pyrinomonadaceae bacterium]|nr:FtsX-like permease family protein [Pyrinomonadaceae bacterium]
MRTADLIQRSLKYYWRTNLAVVFGVATAVAVLAGALLVGDSVRASLRDLFLQRLGQTDQVITSTSFFREQLAEDIHLSPPFTFSCPLIEMDGTVSRDNGARAGGVRVYGVDRRFWRFHGRFDQTPPENREVSVSESLARELNTRAGDSLLVRIEKPSNIPLESLFARKDDSGRTLRLTVRETLAPEQLGEFSTRPQQGGVRAVFVPLQLLQKELAQQGRVNTILISGSKDTAGVSETEKTKRLAGLLKEAARLEDYNIKVRVLDEPQSPTGAQASGLQGTATETVALPSGLSVENGTGMISETLAQKVKDAAQQTGNAGVSQYFSYLINSLRLENGSAIPYSIVTAMNPDLFEGIRLEKSAYRRGCDVSATDLPPLILNEWAAKDLGAKIKDRITLDYYVWLEPGQLATRSTEFRVTCIIPMDGLASDRHLVPDYPGISESEHLSDWDPPFPIDLSRIRPQDEEYWKKYRTTPKAFLPLSVGQKLWQSRFGNLTSLRINPASGQDFSQMRDHFEQNLRKTLDPSQMGIAILPVRSEGLAASRGATDFGEYFLYFSFFIVVSALLLASLFFKFGIEQRLREIGTLQAVGFSAAKIRTLFLTEGLVLSLFGSLLGLLGAVAYGYVILFGLRTWWVDAVGTTQLRLHVSPLSLLLGGIGGVLAAVICVALTLRRLGRVSSRSLLTGVSVEQTRRHGEAGTRRFSVSPRLRVSVSRLQFSIVLAVLAALVLLAASFKLTSQVAGFFGGGALLLAALLLYVSASLRRPRQKSIQGTGWPAISRLGFRNSTHRPARSVLCIALIAMSAFIIVAVDAFRHGNRDLSHDRKSGSGGFPLMAESLLPLVYDPNSMTGREALGLSNDQANDQANDQVASAVAKTSFTRFRMRAGDDASCLNLYQPRNPRILGATTEFIQSNRFTFQKSLATTPAETANPWLLLNRKSDDVVPVIADRNSMTYVLHLGVGDELVLNRSEGPVRLRLVGALADSIFQSELLMSEENFVRLFPDQAGYRYFLIDTPERDLSAITTALENRLSDYGFDVTNTAERLTNFHRVEDTYLSTFQMLGGLGLLLGTLGLAAVLLRNVFERRKELALLRAVGYNSNHFAIMVIAENTLLLVLGLAIGTVCALLAIAPAVLDRGGRLPNASLGVLLLTVLISGLTASLVATWAALRSPLLPALKAE